MWLTSPRFLVLLVVAAIVLAAAASCFEGEFQRRDSRVRAAPPELERATPEPRRG